MALVTYYGGKARLSTWIVEHMPPHRAYVEPFGGMASVLLAKPKAYTEVYNDADGTVVNLFRVLRDRPSCAQLIEMLELTPYSREEYEHAWYTRKEGTPVERAWKFLLHAQMGVGSASTVQRTSLAGWENRLFSQGRSAVIHNNAGRWLKLPQEVRAVATRLRHVAIEHRDALAIIDNYRGTADAGVLFYCDPPYLGADNYPVGRFGEAHHEELLRKLVQLDDMVMISGYDADLYTDYLRDWDRVEKRTTAMNNKPCTEILWRNPAARDKIHGGEPEKNF